MKQRGKVTSSSDITVIGGKTHLSHLLIEPQTIHLISITEKPQTYFADYQQAFDAAEDKYAKLYYFKYLIASLLAEGIIHNTDIIAYNAENLDRMKQQVVTLLGNRMKKLLTIE